MYGESPKSPEFADVCTRARALAAESGGPGMRPAYELEDAAAEYVRGHRWQLQAAMHHTARVTREAKADRQLRDAFCAGADWGAAQMQELARSQRMSTAVVVGWILGAGAGLAAIVLMVLR